MQKPLALFLAAALAVSLAACGGSSGAADSAPVSAPVSAPAPTAAPVSTPEPTPTPEPTVPPVAGQVAYDQDGLTVTVQDLVFSTGFEPSTLSLTFANSGTAPVQVQLGHLVLNRYMFDSTLDVEVPAGQTVDGEIPISSLALYQNGLPSAADVAFSLLLTVDGTTTETELYHLAVPDGYERTAANLSGAVVYRGDSLLAACSFYDIKNAFLEISLQNTGDRLLTVSLQSLKLAGSAANASFTQDILPDTVARVFPYVSEYDGSMEELDDLAAQGAPLPVEMELLITDTATGETVAESGPLTFEVTF